MTDAFALFGLPPRPWLDPETLKDEFHRRSATSHPDAGGAAADFTELNRAYQTLRDPVTRLRHLLTLEAPGQLAERRPLPPALAAAFSQVAAARQGAEAGLSKMRGAASPLQRALLAEEVARQRASLREQLAALNAETSASLARLQHWDRAWRDHLAELTDELSALSYLQKWSAQLRELDLQFDLLR